MATESGRLTAREIYERVLDDARSELNRTASALGFSGLAAGLFMGLTGLGVSGTLAALPGDGGEFIAELLYPLGFIAVVIGRAQLFTENTLFPVVLILEERRHLPATLRLWVVVFAANVLGALTFAALATVTGALQPAVVAELVQLGVKAVDQPLVSVFTSGILGGLLIALMSWLVTSAQSTIGQIAVIWLITFPVGLLGLAHCIASSGYILAATLAGATSLGTYVMWLGAATAGNIIGGVLLVSLLNYGQVRAGAQMNRRRARRLAENEAVFSRLSERLRQRSSANGEPEGIAQFRCECSTSNCTTEITMSVDDYRHLRSHSRWFAVVSGHQTPEIEPVVEEHHDYLIVERNEKAGEPILRPRPWRRSPWVVRRN
ncbi:formate/nitrite transporter family protein [Haloactinomyces albus]|uniref:Formate/nitrite transporter FocA (FNT family) n=1 Tax=Haloactinomyces albus TaxID=1352928 RepID=A0AAE4CP64_9ACTN|nr:formate/nitrite transporter family protein [Haloactinomyces albus]MDR7301378.1 formate/nitrite transporter FocA (FNT family) [Haloactinomyces albus]